MTRDASQTGVRAPASTAPDLKYVVCPVYLRQKDREQRTWRRACQFAAESHEDQDWCNPSDKERATFRAVAREKAPLTAVRGTDRLRQIVEMKWLDSARTIIREEESQRLGRSRFAATSWEVTYEAIVEAASKLVPALHCLVSPELAQGWESGFKRYCEWLVTGEGTPDETWHDAFRILDGAGLRDELLNKLWNECNAECRDIGLPEPTEKPSERETGIDQWVTAVQATKVANNITGVGRDWSSYWRRFCDRHDVKRRSGRKRDDTPTTARCDVEVGSLVRTILQHEDEFQKATPERERRKQAMMERLRAEHGINSDLRDQLLSTD